MGALPPRDCVALPREYLKDQRSPFSLIKISQPEASYIAVARSRRFRAGGMARISRPVKTCSVFMWLSTTA